MHKCFMKITCDFDLTTIHRDVAWIDPITPSVREGLVDGRIVEVVGRDTAKDLGLHVFRWREFYQPDLM